jgi:hypothetical protein
MAKSFAILVLLASMAGSVLAGIPFHAGEKACATTAHGDCCATAQSHSQAPEATAARLCCALNCTAPGTAIPASANETSQTLTITLRHVTIPAPALAPLQPAARSYLPPGSQQHSHPAYIRHLALLI